MTAELKICNYHEIVYISRECPCCDNDIEIVGLKKEIEDLKIELRNMEI